MKNTYLLGKGVPSYITDTSEKPNPKQCSKEWHRIGVSGPHQDEDTVRTCHFTHFPCVGSISENAYEQALPFLLDAIFCSVCAHTHMRGHYWEREKKRRSLPQIWNANFSFCWGRRLCFPFPTQSVTWPRAGMLTSSYTTWPVSCQINCRAEKRGLCLSSTTTTSRRSPSLSPCSRVKVIGRTHKSRLHFQKERRHHIPPSITKRKGDGMLTTTRGGIFPLPVTPLSLWSFGLHLSLKNSFQQALLPTTPDTDEGVLPLHTSTPLSESIKG